MSDQPIPDNLSQRPSLLGRVDEVCSRFEQDWQAGRQPKIGDFLGDVPDPDRSALLRDLIAMDLHYREHEDRHQLHQRYLDEYPQYASLIEEVLADSPTAESQRGDTSIGSKGAVLLPQDPPEQIGRYKVEGVLGTGAFGYVYLARDEELNRDVAIKVPRPERIGSPQDVDRYMDEARMLAALDHPNVVPVFDVGRTEDGLCYVVSKRIEGRNLTAAIAAEEFNARDTSELVATVAEALQHTHNRGLVHRDIKPANILLDDTDKPFVADFGLALRDEDLGKQEGMFGTPAYTSPEQARGEGHLVDGRSDVFSLGVVLYELLTGERPFGGRNWREVLQNIVSAEPRPLRQVKGEIPEELDRVCLKALAKRTRDRYQSAADMASDLRHWREARVQQPAESAGPVRIVPKGLQSFDAGDSDFFLDLLPGPRDRGGLPESVRFWKTRIDELDNENTFRVGLIYGPSGCGKSSFVKAGLLPRVAEHVIPAFVESTGGETETRLLAELRRVLPDMPHDAGLAEALAAVRRGRVIPAGRKLVIVLDQFEQWLHANRGQEGSELIQALRQCDGGRVQCLLLVRDDFWLATSRMMQALEIDFVPGHNSALVDLFDPLHARRVLTEFGRAFGRLPDAQSQVSRDQQDFLDRAVDGLAEDDKVICVRLALFADMIKGKPWTRATLRQVGGTAGLGVTFLEETFSAETGPAAHRHHQKAAQAVLKALLPPAGTNIKGGMRSSEELLAAADYARRPKDFEELLRILDKELRLITPTDPGAAAAGADQSAASEAGRQYYQLTHDFLVPSLREWLTRKQKETRRGRAELRLAELATLYHARPEKRHLPSLVEWLGIRTFIRKEHWTQPQLAMIRRADRFHLSRLTTAVVLLGLITASGFWIWHRVEQNRRELLAEKAREQEQTRIEGLVGQLVRAEPNQLPQIVKELDANWEIAAPFLSPLLSQQAETADEKRSQLHARLAGVSRDDSLIEPLVEELLAGKVTYVMPIREQLRPAASRLTERFRRLLRNEKADNQDRLRAALALADYVPESEAASWTEQDVRFVAEQLVSSNAEFQPLLRDALRPIRAALLPDLELIFGDAKATDAQRLSAANAFADYSGDDIARLSRLLAVAAPEQYKVLYPLVAASPTPAIIEDLEKIAGTLPPADLGSVERVPFGQRRDNAAVTLLRLGEREKVLPVFEMADDPEALTQFIFRCRPRSVGVDALLECLDRVSDVPREAAAQDRYPANTRYALLLALGEYRLEELPASRRVGLLRQLAEWYATDPSSGVHGAAGWLLRKWGQAEIATKIDQTPVPYSADREWFTLAITVTPTAPPQPAEDRAEDGAAAQEGANKDAPPAEDSAKATGAEASATAEDGSDTESSADESAKAAPASEALPPKSFYYTFIVFPSGEYQIGSVADEPERSTQEEREQRHSVTLTRPFALLDREVTFEELIAFSPQYAGFMQQYNARPTDAGFGPDWYDSVGFCRWLGEQSGLLESDQPYASPDSLDAEAYPREPNPSANWAPRDWPLDVRRGGFRLPTDAEWEVAARGGARTAYGYGGDVSLLRRFGWFVENSGKHVHTPRELRPGIRGVFDLHGNLYEWTHDWYGGYGSEAVRDPLGPNGGSVRVFRGGCWSHTAAFCRAAFRLTFVPTYRSSNSGFRLALSPSGVTPEASPASPE